MNTLENIISNSEFTIQKSQPSITTASIMPLTSSASPVDHNPSWQKGGPNVYVLAVDITTMTIASMTNFQVQYCRSSYMPSR